MRHLDKDEARALLVELVCDVLAVDTIKDRDTFEHLGADSQAGIELILRIEEEFEFDEVPDEVTKKLRGGTVGDAWKYILKRLALEYRFTENSKG